MVINLGEHQLPLFYQCRDWPADSPALSRSYKSYCSLAWQWLYRGWQALKTFTSPPFISFCSTSLCISTTLLVRSSIALSWSTNMRNLAWTIDSLDDSVALHISVFSFQHRSCQVECCFHVDIAFAGWFCPVYNARTRSARVQGGSGECLQYASFCIVLWWSLWAHCTDIAVNCLLFVLMITVYPVLSSWYLL